MPEPIEVRFSCIGDSSIGKTVLLYAYFHDMYGPESEYDESLGFSTDLTLNGTKFLLYGQDSDASVTNEILRSDLYEKVDVILLCFSIIDEKSFLNIETRWIPEITKLAKDVPVVLVGTHGDYRVDPPEDTTLVSKEQAEELVTRLQLYKYLECCTKTKEGLSDIFNAAATAAHERMLTKGRSGRGRGGDGGSSCEIM
ncbi:putative Cell division control protein 42 like protein [Blattamonas nauphoetae]|uniref:Cell division control protein 42 like protein n=1 Tax=Blattamonas nauphoetae TaxID=2049346 RepID=A0ABQ9X994_9EUKA|nr:putative Cell division control protein 42 like protein [Blattamonas nauphoetae]